MPHVRHLVVGKRSGIRAAAQPAYKVTLQNTLDHQGKDSVHGLVTLRNSREEALLFAQIHAGKQLHNIRVTVFSVVCKCRAETAQQTGHSAGAHEQRHRLAVAFAVVQVAPAVPYALFDEFHVLAGWTVGSKNVLSNIADIQGFAQALQGSNEEEARDRMDGHGEGSAGHGAGTHICDAGVMTAVACWQPWQRRQRQDPGRRQAWFGRAARLHLCEALLLLRLWSPERGRAWLGTSFAFSTSA